jgi:hypothetical protein
VTILSKMEGLMGFIITLQAAEIAFIGLLIASGRMGPMAVGLIALVLGAPTLLLTHVMHLRALDTLIINRRYLLAMNSIRRYFVNNYPQVADAILLPTRTREAPIKLIGSSVSVSVGSALILFLLAGILMTALVAVAAWVILYGATSLSTTSTLFVAMIVGLVLGSLATFIEWFRANRRLRAAGHAFSRAVKREYFAARRSSTAGNELIGGPSKDVGDPLSKSGCLRNDHPALTGGIGIAGLSPVLVSLLRCGKHGNVEALAAAVGHRLIDCAFCQDEPAGNLHALAGIARRR